mmetsp:Transcript_68809/g.191641  ORF Transcript_68809/g.191641 Transcript_68809/m.191641 type:complete len:81 (-) Transcript_68809:134-376(-)
MEIHAKARPLPTKPIIVEVEPLPRLSRTETATARPVVEESAPRSIVGTTGAREAQEKAFVLFKNRHTKAKLNARLLKMAP